MNAPATRFVRDSLLLVPVPRVFFLPFLPGSRTRPGFLPNLGLGLGLPGACRFLP
jgi:hypothetical protein